MSDFTNNMRLHDVIQTMKEDELAEKLLYWSTSPADRPLSYNVSNDFTADAKEAIDLIDDPRMLGRYKGAVRRALNDWIHVYDGDGPKYTSALALLEIARAQRNSSASISIRSFVEEMRSTKDLDERARQFLASALDVLACCAGGDPDTLTMLEDYYEDNRLVIYRPQLFISFCETSPVHFWRFLELLYDAVERCGVSLTRGTVFQFHQLVSSSAIRKGLPQLDRDVLFFFLQQFIDVAASPLRIVPFVRGGRQWAPAGVDGGADDLRDEATGYAFARREGRMQLEPIEPSGLIAEYRTAQYDRRGIDVRILVDAA